MLRKARYRVVLYILLLLIAYIALQMLASPDQPPWGSHRLAFTVYADSLDSTEFKVIESSDSRTIDGVYLAVVLIQIIESPVYFRDEFELLDTGFKRVEIGRSVEVRPGFNLTADANDASADIAAIRSNDFLKDLILTSVEEGDLTPAMEHLIRDNATLGGKVIEYPRLVTTVVANVLWMFGWLALVFEGILEYLRGRRRKHQRHHDLCLHCSYQLTRDLQQCPECGTQINWRSYSPEARV